MLGVSHGALQFMTYEEMKNAYNEYRKLPIDTKLVSVFISANCQSLFVNISLTSIDDKIDFENYRLIA